MSIEQDLKNIALEALYMKPEMIQFLLVENLALKTLLHDKQIISPEEFKRYKEKAAEILELGMREKLAQVTSEQDPS